MHALAQIEIDRARGQTGANPRRMVRQFAVFGRRRLSLSEDTQPARPGINPSSHTQNLSDPEAEVDA